MTNDIKYFNGQYRFLSNFWPCLILYEGVVYPSVEHAYQANKTLDKDKRLLILQMSAGQSKRFGRKIKLRDDWEDVKLQIMEELLRQKFDILAFRHLLNLTGDSHIEEGNTWGDTFWGVCKGEGENNLGKIIMKIRDEK